jgi:hypothetical protein
MSTPSTIWKTRPETHEDLPDYLTEGHMVALVAADYLVRFPTLGLHLLAALGEAKGLGLHVTDEGKVMLPKSDAELNTALRQQQETWDRARANYNEARVDPSSITNQYARNAVDRWAAAESQPAIVWPEVTR